MDSAKAQVVQCTKSIHQATIDEGNWKHAWLLTGLVDPGVKRLFSADEDQLEVLAEYAKNFDDLETRLHNG